MGYESWQELDDAQGERLARYISGRSSAHEAEEIRAWIAATPKRGELVESLQSLWELAGRPQGFWDVNAAWDELRARRARRRPAYGIQHSPARMATRSPRLLRAAAVLVLALGGAAVWKIMERPVAADAVAMREVVTGPGQRATVELNDGSRVTVGVQSRLRFPSDFGHRARELELEGEAYFVVVHDNERPFTVIAGGTKTVDLGTAFVVRAHPTDTDVQVIVTEGKVSLAPDAANTTRAVVLTRGEMGRVRRGQSTPSVHAVDPTLYTGWLQGKLVFDRTPLPMVAAELERWYGLHVRIADEQLSRETLTATFGSDSLAEILRTMEAVLDMRASREADTLTLRKARR